MKVEFTQDQVIALCDKYRYLIPRNAFTANISSSYRYTYTVGSYLNGWYRLFLLFCKNALPYLKENNIDKDFFFYDVKEKYGMLEMYVTHLTNDETIGDLISAYRRMSKFVCHNCGEVADYISMGWISPWCEECRLTTESAVGEEFEEAPMMRGRNLTVIREIYTYIDGKQKRIKRKVKCKDYWNEYRKCKDMTDDEFFEYLMK